MHTAYTSFFQTIHIRNIYTISMLTGNIVVHVCIALSNVHECVLSEAEEGGSFINITSSESESSESASLAVSPHIILDDVSDSSLLGCWLGWPNPDWTEDQT